MGGAVLTQMGPPIPLPNIVVEGQSGIKPIREHSTDINYGMNLTALAFGTIGMHVLLICLLSKMVRPSLSVTERIHIFINNC